MRAHADTDHRYLRDLVPALNAASLGVFHHWLQHLQRLLVIIAMHCEREVGHPVVPDVLHDHINVDVSVADRAENLVGNTRLVRNPEHGNFGFVLVERNA